MFYADKQYFINCSLDDTAKQNKALFCLKNINTEIRLCGNTEIRFYDYLAFTSVILSVMVVHI